MHLDLNSGVCHMMHDVTVAPFTGKMTRGNHVGLESKTGILLLETWCLLMIDYGNQALVKSETKQTINWSDKCLILSFMHLHHAVIVNLQINQGDLWIPNSNI